MIEIHYNITDFELFLYSPENQFLGVLRYESDVLDILLQIRRNKLEGYYIIDSADGEKYIIEHDGRVSCASGGANMFRSRNEDLLTEFVGF